MADTGGRYAFPHGGADERRRLDLLAGPNRWRHQASSRWYQQRTPLARGPEIPWSANEWLLPY